MATGTDSVARVTSQNENLHRQETAESLDKSVMGGHLPVFEAFNELGLTGCDIADIAVVTPPTVSKWRMGKARLPNDRLVFLTLILAHLLDEVEVVKDEGKSTAHKARLDSARALLTMQDVLNKDLPVGDIRDGAKKFRTWWASGAAERLKEKRFHLALNGGVDRELEILKARVKRP